MSVSSAPGFAVRLRSSTLLVLIAAAFVGAPGPAAAQEVLGKVIDAGTGDPVPGMEVVVRSLDGARVYRTLASEAGRFRVRVDAAGAYVIAASRIGYSGVATTEIEVSPGQNVFVELRVEPSALTLEGIRVVATARNPYLEVEGFYDRMEQGWGKYIEREQIETYPSTWPSHLLRSRGVSIRNGRVQGCRLLIDGMQIDWDISLDDILDKRHMAAVEIYGGTGVPVELRRHRAECVVAIWTTWGEEVVNRRGRR